MVKLFLYLTFFLFILGGCASKMKDQMKDYRTAFIVQDFDKASSVLEKSDLKNDKRSVLLWHLERGSLTLAQGREDDSIHHFQLALDLIDKLFTTKLSSKAATFLVNDASDEFYGASYERSYAHYFLVKALYQRYLKKGNILDLQGARGTILAWDSYFSELQRSATSKTLYSTDLMLKIFGGQIHEVSKIKNDKQIALQLYKDAVQILNSLGGIFSLFNKKSVDYIKHYESEGKSSSDLFISTLAKDDLKDFLHFKILSLTKEIRAVDFDREAKSLHATKEMITKAMSGPGNVVFIFEEGLIPEKVAKPFNFGIKGAIGAVENPGAKAFINTFGAELVTAFAMNKLGMIPERTSNAGSFIFAHDVTRLAVQEAAIEFELPMIDHSPIIQRLELFILDEKGVTIQRSSLPIISDNGEIARIVLEEDVVSRYVRTGTRIAIKHLVAIVAALKIYHTLQKTNQNGDFLAKTAAMATYIGASKGLSMLERADIRHWSTLPNALRMAELTLKPGNYKVGIGTYSGDQRPQNPTKILGNFQVKNSEKSILTFSLH
jgi:hypothetical protein